MKTLHLACVSLATYGFSLCAPLTVESCHGQPTGNWLLFVQVYSPGCLRNNLTMSIHTNAFTSRFDIHEFLRCDRVASVFIQQRFEKKMSGFITVCKGYAIMIRKYCQYSKNLH